MLRASFAKASSVRFERSQLETVERPRGEVDEALFVPVGHGGDSDHVQVHVMSLAKTAAFSGDRGYLSEISG
jgi:hypothetical protein